jgi:hypothetical protein
MFVKTLKSFLSFLYDLVAFLSVTLLCITLGYYLVPIIAEFGLKVFFHLFVTPLLKSVRDSALQIVHESLFNLTNDIVSELNKDIVYLKHPIYNNTCKLMVYNNTELDMYQVSDIYLPMFFNFSQNVGTEEVLFTLYNDTWEGCNCKRIRTHNNCENGSNYTMYANICSNPLIGYQLEQDFEINWITKFRIYIEESPLAQGSNPRTLGSSPLAQRSSPRKSRYLYFDKATKPESIEQLLTVEYNSLIQEHCLA